MISIAIWSVAGGVVGARLYHVVTDWSRFSDDLGRIPMIWMGGLGIPGGLLGGVICGIYVARRHHVPVAGLLTAVAPAIPLAQSIGRWGNWWNQELFGRATNLPWALQIADDKLPAGFVSGTTFHPTFLYESLWNLALCLALLALERRATLRPGRLFAFYTPGTGGDAHVAQIDKKTAHVIDDVPMTGVQQGRGWAFAFWGGDFWLFTDPRSEGASTVTRARPSRPSRR